MGRGRWQERVQRGVREEGKVVTAKGESWVREGQERGLGWAYASGSDSGRGGVGDPIFVTTVNLKIKKNTVISQLKVKNTVVSSITGDFFFIFWFQ